MEIVLKRAASVRLESGQVVEVSALEASRLVKLKLAEVVEKKAEPTPKGSKKKEK